MKSRSSISPKLTRTFPSLQHLTFTVNQIYQMVWNVQIHMILNDLKMKLIVTADTRKISKERYVQFRSIVRTHNQ